MGSNAIKSVLTAADSHEVRDHGVNVPFRRQLEALEQSDKDIREGLHAVICDPSYDIRRIAELSNSDHDCLHDMNHFLQLLSALMDLGGPGICSILHFSSRNWMSCWSRR